MKGALLVLLASFSSVPAHAYTRAELEKHAEVAAARHGVPADALKSICTRESHWNPNAIGAAGEIGLCQLRPTTVLQMYGPKWRNDLTVRQGLDLIETELRDPIKNLDLAAQYLKWMLREADGNVKLAIAGYNGGPGVIRYVQRVSATMKTMKATK